MVSPPPPGSAPLRRRASAHDELLDIGARLDVAGEVGGGDRPRARALRRRASPRTSGHDPATPQVEGQPLDHGATPTLMRVAHAGRSAVIPSRTLHGPSSGSSLREHTRAPYTPHGRRPSGPPPARERLRRPLPDPMYGGAGGSFPQASRPSSRRGDTPRRRESRISRPGADRAAQAAPAAASRPSATVANTRSSCASSITSGGWMRNTLPKLPPTPMSRPCSRQYWRTKPACAVP